MRRLRFHVMAVVAVAITFGTTACHHEPAGTSDVVVEYDIDSPDPKVRFSLRVAQDDSARLTYLDTVDDTQHLPAGTATRLIETLLANGFEAMPPRFENGRGGKGGPTIGLSLNARGIKKSVRAVAQDVAAKDVYLIQREIARIVGLLPWFERLAAKAGVTLDSQPAERVGK